MKNLRIEFAILSILALLILGGFASLSTNEDFSNEITGDFSLLSLKSGAKSCEQSGGKWIVGRGTAKCICPKNKILRDARFCIDKQQSRIVSPTLVKDVSNKLMVKK